MTTTSASEEDVRPGRRSDPHRASALHVQHYAAVSGNTLDVYVWKAVSEGGLTLPLGQDEHQFEFSFMALRSGT